ncbi:MAG: ribonuclease III [Phycisphaerales bacterium]
MDETTRVELEAMLGHTFGDPAILERALRHASVCDSRLDSNERLEFLGDAVLGLVACQRIFELFPGLLEGEMTKIKSMVVSRRTCARMADRLGLASYIEVGKGMQTADELPRSLGAAALEAVIAAIYLDAGMDAAARFLCPLLDPMIRDAARSGHQQNFKSVLQQHAQQMMGQTPTYRILDEKGPDHAKAFRISVELDGKKYEASWGQSKKQAEQAAALNALRALGVIEADESGEMRIVRGVRSN